MKSELEKTAYHEAAHSVAGYARDAYQGGVSIEPNNEDGSLGHSRGEEHMPTDDWSEEDIEDRIIDFYAGFAADVRLDPASEEKAYRQAENDTESAERYLRLLSGDRDENEKRLRAKAATFVETHWEEISRLARDLLEYRTLDGCEAMTIIEIVRGDATEEDLLGYRHFRDACRRRADRGQ